MITTTQYKIPGTKSFRLGSQKFFGVGQNMQNVDKDTRYMYKPRPGYELIQVDQAGAEAYIVAYIAPAGKFLKLFQLGMKSHTFVGAHIFADKWDKAGFDLAKQNFGSDPEVFYNSDQWKPLAKLIASSKVEYALGKMTCHAANYGMHEGTFVTNVLKQTRGTVRLSRSEGKYMLDTYHQLFPEIRLWHKKTIETLLRNNWTLRNLFGYPRRFPALRDDTNFRDAFSWVPQSTVGTITNLAITELQNEIEEGRLIGVNILQNGHDSILLERHIETTDRGEICARVSKAMQKELVGSNGRFTMRTEASYGKSWGEQTECD